MKRQPLITTCLATAVFSFASAASAQQFNGDVPANGACFYDQIDYGGQYVCVEAGKDAGYINELNDKVSSIRFFGDARVTAFEDAGFRGPSTDFSQDVSDLRGARWNDVISSVKVAPAVNRKAEASTSSQAAAERVVQSAYQDLLGRDADPDGLRLYSDSMVNKGMTAVEVRAAIRNSSEYRATQIVRRAYRRVLGREPDKASVYVERVMKDGWTLSQVEQDLRNTDEYRARRR